LDISPAKQEKIKKFAAGADLVVVDSQFDDFEAELYRDWGHSCVNAFIDILGGSGVKSLALFHYNPQESEAKVDGIFASAKKHLRKTYPKSKMKIFCAVEGQGHTL
jgi:ribonuclease BN (tRNA processing enzyme)